MKGSLSSVTGYRSDAFASLVAQPFKPENTVFGQFTFLPWVRTGLAAALESPVADALRGAVQVAFHVKDDDGSSEAVDHTLVVRGPGDVIGLDPAQIVRRYPAHGTIDAEESLLAHIEFDRPELPWLFSPFAVGGGPLAPWLALVVCDATLSEEEPGAPGMPRRLRTRMSELQPLADTWAWAHAQVIGPKGDASSIADRLSASHGPVNLSRLLCPRKLDRGRHYIAAVVPAFDCGRQSALGEHGGTLGPAWVRAADGRDADLEFILPIFDSWRFSVADFGDFEQLAGRLHGVAAPWNVGRRLIDASKPRGRITDLASGDPGVTQVLRCALVSPTPVPRDQVPEASAWGVDKRDELRREVDRSNAPDDDLPRVGARLYARFPRGDSVLGPVFGEPAASAASADGDWFSQLNTSPMHRIVAGVGTRVVQRDQEQLVQAAWAQVGDVRKANTALVQLQFGRYVGEALHRNHFSKLAVGELTQILRGVHTRVLATGSASTLHGVLAGSSSAPAAMTAAFRRASRVRGPLARFTTPSGKAVLKAIVSKGDAYRDFRRAYADPDGIRTLSADAIAALPADLVARKLGVNETVAHVALGKRLAARNPTSIADRLAQPIASWKVPAGTIDLGQRAASAIATQVREASPASFARESTRAEALAPLWVGLANSGVGEISTRARQTVGRIAARLPFSAIPSSRGEPVGIGSVARIRTAVALQAEASVLRLPTAERAVAPLEARIRFESAASRSMTDRLAGTRAVAFTDVAAALSQLAQGTGAALLPLMPDRPALAFTRAALLASVAPATTLTRYANLRLGTLPAWLPPNWFADGRVAPIMAAPHFDHAMFDALERYDRDWLVPGLGQIALTDFVTVLSTNPEFTESFLVGLSDEMGRELLWRGYPTDQRGTYFRRFWNERVDDLKDDIHRFDRVERTPLGTHLAGDGLPRVVLLVRGELVRRYPDAVLMAMRAGPDPDSQGRPVFSADPKYTARILFHKHLAPDILLVGFDLSLDQISIEPWWFLIAENPSAPRFGLDLPPEANGAAARGVQRNNLDWNDLGALSHGRFLDASARTLAIADETDGAFTWPGSAAVVARTLLQSPFRAAFNAHKLITPRA